MTGIFIAALVTGIVLTGCANESKIYTPERVLYRIDESRFFEVKNSELKFCEGESPTLAGSGDVIYYTDKRRSIHSAITNYGRLWDSEVGPYLMIDPANVDYLALPIALAGLPRGGTLNVLYFSQDAGRTWKHILAPVGLVFASETWLTGAILSALGGFGGTGRIDLSLDYPDTPDGNPLTIADFSERWRWTVNGTTDGTTPGYFQPVRRYPIDRRFNCKTGEARN